MSERGRDGKGSGRAEGRGGLIGGRVHDVSLLHEPPEHLLPSCRRSLHSWRVSASMPYGDVVRECSRRERKGWGGWGKRRKGAWMARWRLEYLKQHRVALHISGFEI